jgi:3-oxoacyl-(acyl-carrier-protein) synthase
MRKNQPMGKAVITGIGIATSLGFQPSQVLDRILSGENIFSKPDFDVTNFNCKICSPIKDFDAEKYFPDNKSLRLMNRDAQMAVVAAKLAIEDAGIFVDQTYRSYEIGLFGSTGVAGMSIEEIAQIIKYAANEDGTFDLNRFGNVALKRVRPVLSFRILPNMPLCFVSIFLNIKGPNAVYTPWEGNGAQAIAAGIRAINSDKLKCALVGGCDVKTRELSFLNLQQLGVFNSWRKYGTGNIPGEGAAFLVLEDEQAALNRGRKYYAQIRDYNFGSLCRKINYPDIIQLIVERLNIKGSVNIISAGDGDIDITKYEEDAFEQSNLNVKQIIKPKSHIGNLFAAAAPLQVSLAAELISRSGNEEKALVNCFGYGSEQGSFVLERI